MTPGSTLTNMLQGKDEKLSSSHGISPVRFIERGGERVIDLLGQTNLWASEMSHERGNCLPCKGRQLLIKETEKRVMAKMTGEKIGQHPPQGK